MPKVRALAITSVDQGVSFAEKHGYPVLIKSSFSLRWSATAENQADLARLIGEGLKLSPIGEVLVERPG